MGNKSKMKVNRYTGRVSLNPPGSDVARRQRARKFADKARRWSGIMDPNRKGVNTMAGECA